MSEVLRSPSDIASYESSFTYPPSEEHNTMTSTLESSINEKRDLIDEHMSPKGTSDASPRRMQPFIPSSQPEANQSPTATSAISPSNDTPAVTRRPWEMTSVTIAIPNVKEALSAKATSYTAALTELGSASMSEVVQALCHIEPQNTTEYAELMCKIAYLVHEGVLEETYIQALEKRLYALEKLLSGYIAEDPALSELYLVVECCFDIFLKIAMDSTRDGLSANIIRFLSSILVNLNYWEVYNLIRLNPAVYLFLTLIKFDLNACYTRFVQSYSNFRYKQTKPSPAIIGKFTALREQQKRERDEFFAETSTNDDEYFNKDLTEEHDKFISDRLASEGKGKDKKKTKADSKLSAHRVIKKPEIKPGSARLLNYDPDVIHECQLPSAEEPGKMCLRRFSRKYELIRHQDTVHLKKKKLFKCFVCVKQDPVMGPRIFTRHDTLAKHIRVNHRISGKEAKAEVAYSKKHAEIVDEGDITVHVGRRKTKVDFELRAHMNKGGREAPDGSIIFDDEEMLSGEEGEPMIDVV